MKPFILLLAVLLACPHAPGQELSLDGPMAAHGVLPMQRTLPLSGTAPVGTHLELRFGEVVATTRVDTTGRWKLELPPLPASSEPRNLELRTGDQRLIIEDLLVGRLWYFSGQSNMAFPLRRAVGGRQAAAAADPQLLLRLCFVPPPPTDARQYDQATRQQLDAARPAALQWSRAEPEAAGNFSAVAWWCARALQKADGIPVGAICDAVGGSGTEAWLPPGQIRSDPALEALRPDDWLANPRISAWARGRARLNLGANSRTFDHPYRPGWCFQTRTSRWRGMPLAGVVWYQGETNAELDDRAWHETLIARLVTGWREALGQAQLRFYLVELPRIGGNDPLRAHWPNYRAAQAAVAQALDGVCLVPTTDLGYDSPDVHPPDKQPLAERIAATILAGDAVGGAKDAPAGGAAHPAPTRAGPSRNFKR